MNTIKISVVIPFYNTPLALFKDCVASVKKTNPYEIILVDDCSSDKERVEFAKNSGCIYKKTPFQDECKVWCK